jgi:transposase
MLHLSDSHRYLLYSESADMRKSFHALAALVKYKMQGNILSGDVYIFISKRRNAIKLLRWEGDGFAIFYKRLENGTFEFPGYDSTNNCMLITANEISFILKGIALSKIKYRLRYSHTEVVC